MPTIFTQSCKPLVLRLATMTSLGIMGTPDPQPGSLRGRRRLIPSVKPRLQTFDPAIAISASAPPPFAQHFQRRAQALSPLGQMVFKSGRMLAIEPTCKTVRLHRL